MPYDAKRCRSAVRMAVVTDRRRRNCRLRPLRRKRAADGAAARRAIPTWCGPCGRATAPNSRPTGGASGPTATPSGASFARRRCSSRSGMTWRTLTATPSRSGAGGPPKCAGTAPELIGIDRHAVAPPGGAIVHAGEPTGLLHECGQVLVQPPSASSSLPDGMASTAEKFARTLTGLGDTGGTDPRCLATHDIKIFGDGAVLQDGLDARRLRLPVRERCHRHRAHRRDRRRGPARPRRRAPARRPRHRRPGLPHRRGGLRGGPGHPRPDAAPRHPRRLPDRAQPGGAGRARLRCRHEPPGRDKRPRLGDRRVVEVGRSYGGRLSGASSGRTDRPPRSPGDGRSQWQGADGGGLADTYEGGAVSGPQLGEDLAECALAVGQPLVEALLPGRHRPDSSDRHEPHGH